MKTAIVTGATGQDGAYLISNLISRQYNVIALVRRSSNNNFTRLQKLGVDIENIKTEYFDLCEPFNIERILNKHNIDEFYNLSAQSFVGSSFELPLYTLDANCTGVVRILEAIRQVNPKIKFYQASTSEMYGKVQQVPQTESTPFYPRSPYGVAKLAAYWMSVNYRESYNMFVCNGILFNHESPLRGIEFVTRKIVNSLQKIKDNKQETLKLGNIDARRDWGHAKDYVEAMYLMLQQPLPDDYVISTGETHTVREFIEISSKSLDFDIVWKGVGVNEQGIDRKTGKVVIEIDPQFFRPSEVDLLIGDSAKAKKSLGWSPKFTFENLIEDMITNCDMI